MTIKRILCLDTETTGLNPDKDVTIEVACTLFDVDLGCPIESFASLIRSDRNEAEAINRIPVAALVCGPYAAGAWLRVSDLASRADAFLAHNAAFDFGFTPAKIRDLAPWVCSKFDLEWPKATRPGESLVSLALAHGLGVAHAHRASSDVDTLCRLLARVHETGIALGPFIARGLRPKGRFQALVSYDDRELAKSASFQWEASEKRWTRTLAVEDAAGLPFPVKRLDGAA